MLAAYKTHAFSLSIATVLLGTGCATDDTIHDDQWQSVVKQATEKEYSQTSRSFALMDSLLSTHETVSDSLLAKVTMNRGIYHCMLSRLDSGEVDILRAKELFEGINDTDGISDAYYNLANIKAMSGNLDGAVSYYLKAIDSCSPCSDSTLMTNSYTNLSVLLHRFGEYEESENYVKAALSNSAAADYDKATLHTLMAEVQVGLRDRTRALEHCKLALSHIDSVKTPISYASAAVNLALMEPDSIEQERLIALAERLYRVVPENVRHADLAPILMQYFIENNAPQKARLYFAKSMDLADAIHDEYKKGAVLLRWVLKDKEHDYAQMPIDTLEESLAYLSNSGGYGLAEEVLSHLVIAYKTQGDQVGKERSVKLLEMLKADRMEVKDQRD